MLTMGSEHGNGAASAPPTRFGPSSWASSFSPSTARDDSLITLVCAAGAAVCSVISPDNDRAIDERAGHLDGVAIPLRTTGADGQGTHPATTEGCPCCPVRAGKLSDIRLAAADFYRLHMLRDTGVTKEKAAALRFNECGGLANGWSCKIHPDGTIE